MEKRWTLFLIVTILIYLFFMSSVSRRQKEMRERQKKQQEALVTEEQEAKEKEVSPAPEPEKEGEPVLETGEQPEPEQIPLPPSKEPEYITINTDFYQVELTTRGGRPSRWDLLTPEGIASPESPETKAIPLIEHLGYEEERELPLEIEFREYRATKSYSVLNRMVFDHELRELPSGDIEVIFKSPAIDGISITKRYLFRPSSHVTDLTVTLHNETESNIHLNDKGRGLGVSWGPGLGALVDLKDRYEKRYSRSVYCLEEGDVKGFKPSEDAEDITGEIEWGGQNTRFMLATIIPTEKQGVFFKSVVKTKNLFDEEGDKRELTVLPATATLWLDKTLLDANTSKSFSFKIFVGPRKYNLLKDSGHQLSGAMFYTHMGWLQSLCILLLYILHWLQSLVGNYGIAIIGLTLLVRIATYPLTHKGMKLQAKAMAEQAKLRPLIDELNKKYKDNPQLKNKKMMELYKEHGINPLGFLRGCLPLLIQMPIFISLYFLLSESFELRGAGFLWIKDLSSPDKLFKFGTTLPFLGEYLNLLPILMGTSQIIVSRYSSAASADPSQKTMMYFFPLFFMFIVYNLSSGLVLYWLVSNVLQAGQQFIINRHMKREEAGKKAPGELKEKPSKA